VKSSRVYILRFKIGTEILVGT